MQRRRWRTGRGWKSRGGSFFGNRLVEVQDQLAEAGHGGVVDWVECFVTLGFANRKEFRGGFFVGGELPSQSIEAAEQDFPFGVGRLSREDKANGLLDAPTWIIRREHNPLRQSACRFNVSDVVEGCQSVQRRVRAHGLHS